MVALSIERSGAGPEYRPAQLAGTAGVCDSPIGIIVELTVLMPADDMPGIEGLNCRSTSSGGVHLSDGRGSSDNPSAEPFGQLGQYRQALDARDNSGCSGRRRSRFPVAAKTALASAGAVAAVPGSPIPPGFSRFLTR